MQYYYVFSLYKYFKKKNIILKEQLIINKINAKYALIKSTHTNNNFFYKVESFSIRKIRELMSKNK